MEIFQIPPKCDTLMTSAKTKVIKLSVTVRIIWNRFSEPGTEGVSDMCVSVCKVDIAVWWVMWHCSALVCIYKCVLECSDTLSIGPPSADSSQPVSVSTKDGHTTTHTHTHCIDYHSFHYCVYGYHLCFPKLTSMINSPTPSLTSS